ncbi:hypothetical protein Tcan_15221 [Toxocara canis]|uniref:Uncharacterized protein n=1 Tax=Toxocara canis TaxID=6265 RepID=A0A0B2W007_TOXCA|nr:hypothetical protein Tcan_15221 [Toxocara canis]
MGGHETTRVVRLDQSMPLSNHATPRSISWSRPKRSASAAPRSNSASRIKEQKEEEERRAMAEAAFTEWLIRKNKLPRGPRCSPSRDQIVQHVREDARQKVLNIWLARSHPSKKSSANIDHMSRSYHSDTS